MPFFGFTKPVSVETILFAGLTATKKPPTGKAWLILGGHIDHKTGTTTCLYVIGQNEAADSKNYEKLSEISSVLPDQYVGYPCFLDVKVVAATNYVTGYSPNIIALVLDSECIIFVGAATSSASVKVLQFDMSEFKNPGRW